MGKKGIVASITNPSPDTASLMKGGAAAVGGAAIAGAGIYGFVLWPQNSTAVIAGLIGGGIAAGFGLTKAHMPVAGGAVGAGMVIAGLYGAALKGGLFGHASVGAVAPARPLAVGAVAPTAGIGAVATMRPPVTPARKEAEVAALVGRFA